jgi:hypothetical protein
MRASLKRRLRGWRTIIPNSVVGLPASLLFIYEQFQGVDITQLIPAKYAAAAVAGMAVLGVILRILTTGPIGHEGEDQKAGG